MTARRLAAALLVGAAVALAVPSTAAAGQFGARTLKLGSKGQDVRALQRNLTTLGYSTPADGLYGTTTKQSVKRLERKRSWRIDGKVSRKDAVRIAKLVANKKRKPSTIYYHYGLTRPSLTLTASGPGTATVEVLDVGAGVIVQAIPVSFAAGGAVTVEWNGLVSSAAAAPDSVYQLRLGDPGTTGASVSGPTKPFKLRLHAFPVPGPHTYGGAASRFGAPRPGHTHQGQDMGAACGERLFAAHGGTVRAKAYQAGGAGYYLVIDGAMTGTDYVYMHMKKPSWLAKGQAVRTGEQVGRVGNTGASSGCHLHFERWTAPGWYVGGSPYDPLPELQYWDAYS